MNSKDGSFTVSYLSDGTCVLSGDYGTLTWKRHIGENQIDYGFPSDESSSRYFAEKVWQFGIKQIIEEFDIEEAWDVLEEYYIDYSDYSDEDLKLLKKEYSKWGEELTKEEFHDFCYEELKLDPEDFGEIGTVFSKAFLFRLNLLRLVSPLIIEEVNKKCLTKKE